ncbi:MAG TPA: hypothetical protein DD381_11990 [Lentisphaeria bacterium]|nr:MAG: hypothetical protein A2X47_10140 [Lentisphaerae bacterium GWF2_38_69]HBM17047.1 hypothetical protein [Lentisphaeria bacterium]
MDFIIFYFSGTGNTWWVMSALKAELENNEKTVEMYSIENQAIKESGFFKGKIDESGHIILGYPIYGSGMPDNMKEILDRLPVVTDHKKISLLCTQASFSGDGSLYPRAELENKGYDFRHSFQVNMTTNFHVGKFPFSMFKPATGKKLEKVTFKALKKIQAYSKMIIDNREFYDGAAIVHVCDGVFMRFGFKKGKKKYPKNFKFFKEKCIRCKICVNTCPTNNINMDPPDMDLVRKDNCILCFRCYNFCPKSAIAFGKCSSSNDRFIRYKGPEGKAKINEIRK